MGEEPDVESSWLRPLLLRWDTAGLSAVVDCLSSFWARRGGCCREGRWIGFGCKLLLHVGVLLLRCTTYSRCHVEEGVTSQLNQCGASYPPLPFYHPLSVAQVCRRACSLLTLLTSEGELPNHYI